MPKNDEPILVSVRVNAALWEYLIGINGGSDVLIPDYFGELWIFIRSRLKTSPKDYRPIPPGIQQGFIRIAIPMQTGSPNKVFNIHTNKNLEENFLYRNYLDEAGQSQVEDFLMRGLKKTFRAFMTGAVSCNDSQEIKSAIYKFCEIHNIAMDAISYEMLKKDWYRYRARHPKIFKKNGTDIVKI